ncbi:MAG: TolC family protein, partial [Prevotella sp.]|nr:TolC family protein [Prevotella sp.]
MRLPIVLFAAILSQSLMAQQLWTLRQCCDYAVEHNISVKQYENPRQQRERQLSTAKNQRLPNLSASVGKNFSFGRGLTAENTYTNTNTSSTSFSL